MIWTRLACLNRLIISDYVLGMDIIGTRRHPYEVWKIIRSSCRPSQWLESFSPRVRFLAFCCENQYVINIRLAAVPFEDACGLFSKDIDQLNAIA